MSQPPTPPGLSPQPQAPGYPVQQPPPPGFPVQQQPPVLQQPPKKLKRFGWAPLAAVIGLLVGGALGSATSSTDEVGQPTTTATVTVTAKASEPTGEPSATESATKAPEAKKTSKPKPEPKPEPAQSVSKTPMGQDRQEAQQLQRQQVHHLRPGQPVRLGHWRRQLSRRHRASQHHELRILRWREHAAHWQREAA